MTKTIPFKVSARTARLIGRENVATSKGAIIELVKNGYDADSPFCIVLIDNRYGVYHNKLSKDDYEKLLELGIEQNMLNSIYQISDDIYIEKNNVNIEQIGYLKQQLRKNTVLYIIDAGEGMTGDIIRNYWMTIGTDNKHSNFVSHGGRVKAGAKGIGRFALDKLGEHCEMLTFFNKEVYVDEDKDGNQTPYEGYFWSVDWNDFEKDEATIDKIGAELEGIKGSTYMNCLNNIDLPASLKQIVAAKPICHGTILKISQLRDIWDDDAISRVFEDLGVLVPPSENHDFSIYLQSLDNPTKYGKVESQFCDDFDYKVVAHADINQNVNIRIYRQEYNIEAIPPSFFERENQKNYPYKREDFMRGYWDTTRTFSQLIPGFRDTDTDGILARIGAFEFSFYYLKRSATKKDDARFFLSPMSI